MPVADPRYLNEADLLLFGNFNPLPFCVNPSVLNETVIAINYKVHRDFFLQREKFKVLFWEGEKREREEESIDAKSIVKNHLAYKLGKALIECKSLWDYIRILYVISYIYDVHRREDRWKEKRYISKPSLKLLSDDLQAQKIKSSPTYVLGQQCIKAYQNKGFLGLCKFLYFDLKRLKKSDFV